MYNRAEEVTLGDIRGVLKKQACQKPTFERVTRSFTAPGWSSVWKVDNDRFLSGTPDLTVRPRLRVAYRPPPLDSLWRCRNTATSASEKWTAS